MAKRTEVNSGKTRAIFDRYLRLLGIAKIKHDWETLAVITSAHLTRIPFENVSKIYRAKIRGIRGMPSLEEYLDGVEHYNFGGTCYTNNYYLHRLLVNAGFDVKLCAADITVNGAPPNGHMVNVVNIDGREAIVDVGFGAPFWQPLPLGSDLDVIMELGTEKYVLKPRDKTGRNRLEFYRDNQLQHGYVLKPAARNVEDFNDVIARSYSDSAPFLNRLIVTRFFENRALVLRNHTLTEMNGTRSITNNLRTGDDIARAIVRHYGIPEDIVSGVLESLKEL